MANLETAASEPADARAGAHPVLER
jgi:hypothetical protein